MTYWATLPLAAVLINGFFLVYTLAQPRRTHVSRAYGALVVFLMLWATIEFIQHLPLGPTAMAATLQALPPIWGAIGFLALNFCYSLLERRRDAAYWASFALWFLITALSVKIDALHEGWRRMPWGVHEVPGPLLYPFVATNVVLPVVYLLVLLGRAQAAASGNMVKILRLVMTGIALNLVFGLLIELVLPAASDRRIPEIGYLSTVLMAFFVHQAVVRYSFLSIGVEEAAIRIFEQAAVGVVISREDGTGVQANGEAARLLSKLAPGDSRPERALFALEAATSSGGREIAVGEGADQTHMWISFAPVSRKGSTVGRIALMRDMTQERLAEKERARLEETLRQSQKMEAIGTLAGGVAHDMNNVLAGIMGCASALLSECQPGTAPSEDLLAILKAARRGRDLTNDLLGFARKSKYHKRQTALNTIAQDVVSLLKRTAPRQTVVEYRSDGHLLDVVADPNQLSHMLMNLCVNAMDACAGGGGRVVVATSVQTHPEARTTGFRTLPPGRYALIEVTDDGIGMNAQTVARAFDPFFTTKEPGKGTGLGLAMVYGAVTAHEGEVVISSAPGEGTTVSVMLPLHSISNDYSMVSSVPPGVAPVDAPLRVLLVDDEAVVRRATRRMLERMGFEVVEARDGVEAVEIFERRSGEIGLVILDMSMPVMDGAECFCRIMAADPSARIIISSGFTRDPSADDLLKKGALGFLAKPYEMSQLAEMISSIE